MTMRPDHSPGLRHRALAAPFCDRCDIPMKLTSIVPTMFPQALDEVLYRCPICQAETKRTFKRRD
jgi:hypothetical protein